MSTQTTVTQLINDRGNPVANHFVIYKDGDIYLQSYNSIVAKIETPFKTVILGRDWNYSRTTSRHLKKFLGDALGFTSSTVGLRKAIKDGNIVVDNNLAI